MTVKRGEIYWVEFSPVKGSEQGGVRPAVVIQNDTGNRYAPTTVVAAITSRIPPQPYRFMVVIEPEESGLPVRSAVNCSQLATIHQTGSESRLRAAKGSDRVEPIGRLSREKMNEVGEAISFNLGI